MPSLPRWPQKANRLRQLRSQRRKLESLKQEIAPLLARIQELETFLEAEEAHVNRQASSSPTYQEYMT